MSIFGEDGENREKIPKSVELDEKTGDAFGFIEDLKDKAVRAGRTAKEVEQEAEQEIEELESIKERASEVKEMADSIASNIAGKTE